MVVVFFDFAGSGIYNVCVCFYQICVTIENLAAKLGNY